MVAIFTKTNELIQLVLTPNRSLDWQGNLRVILGVAIAITIASAPMILMGGWIVIPFALIHVGALTAGLYLTLKKLDYHEVISLENGQLSFQRGDYKEEATSTFPKSAVNILIEERELPIHAPEIDLIAEGHCYHIGEFLNRDDRFKLAKMLQNQLNLRISHLNSFHRVSF